MGYTLKIRGNSNECNSTVPSRSKASCQPLGFPKATRKSFSTGRKTQKSERNMKMGSRESTL